MKARIQESKEEVEKSFRRRLKRFPACLMMIRRKDLVENNIMLVEQTREIWKMIFIEM
jgi:hypothetical protein